MQLSAAFPSWKHWVQIPGQSTTHATNSAPTMTKSHRDSSLNWPVEVKALLCSFPSANLVRKNLWKTPTPRSRLNELPLKTLASKPVNSGGSAVLFLELVSWLVKGVAYRNNWTGRSELNYDKRVDFTFLESYATLGQRRCALSLDDQLIASASCDKAITLCDSATGSN